MERREEGGGGETRRPVRHSGEHAQQPHSWPQLGLCAAILPILLLRELLYISSEYLRIPCPPAPGRPTRPSAWESGRVGRPAIFERIFPAASLPSSPPHAGRPRRRRGIYRGGSSSPSLSHPARRRHDTYWDTDPCARGPPSPNRSQLRSQQISARPRFNRQSRKRSGSFRQHSDMHEAIHSWTRCPVGRGHSYWMEDEEVGRVYGGPCKAATEHEAAGAGGRGLARALGRLLPR